MSQTTETIHESDVPAACTRTLVKILGENWYLVVGETFVMVTGPRENDPAMSEKRIIAEELCGAITAQMEIRMEKWLAAEESKRI
ncbi:MAG TPA: hypothetical protein DCZ63_15085 [Geobacter sp.]|nr:hypothetical protein [Geobacter sp.]